ncbi:MAG TPA: hypothetical protein V6D25_27115 [Leptolyngbyaceae cyanobacterium]
MPSLYIIGGANGSGKTSTSSPLFVAERIINQQPIIYINTIWRQIIEGKHD